MHRRNQNESKTASLSTVATKTSMTITTTNYYYNTSLQLNSQVRTHTEWMQKLDLAVRATYKLRAKNARIHAPRVL